MKRIHSMSFGAQRAPDGRARFRLWAPDARRVDLVRGKGVAGDNIEMRAAAFGWFELEVSQVRAGERYGYRIDGGVVVPDPASRSNPDGVHALSELVDPGAFNWPDDAWQGRPWHEAVVYELHIGCFTPDGTFGAAVDRLDDLVALGVTAIELMPVASYSGHRGWGYDGVLLFAPHASYGRPDDMKHFVAECHRRHLMVLLDVVYNHFGPDGNYLPIYAQHFFNAETQTPWGAAINFDGLHSCTVREFFIHNALYWIDEFHLDGLRIDAVHSMHDSSTLHFVDELALAVRNGPGRNRHVHLVLENDANDPRHLGPSGGGQARHADAQWNDDVHHALHVMVTGETDGCYLDYAAEPMRHFGRALAEGYAWQGEPSPYRAGLRRGMPSAHLQPLAFVNAAQTHDQIGNRALGERIGMLAAVQDREDALRALLACLLLAPSPPMLFMGQEYNASTPFLFFCDFRGDLARAVVRGRRFELARFARFAHPVDRDAIPDPNAESSFWRSKLDWFERDRGQHAEWLAWTSCMLEIRRSMLLPWLKDVRSGEFTVPGPGTLRIVWPLAAGRRWNLLAQLSDCPGPEATACELRGASVYRSHSASGALQPWSVQFTIEPTLTV